MKKVLPMITKRKEIGYFIHYTAYLDWDIIAVGDIKLLRQLCSKICSKNEHFHLIKNSKFGCPIVVIDTFDRLSDAGKEVRRLQKEAVMIREYLRKARE